MSNIPIPTSYELERGKPAPSLNHARLQSKLIQILSNQYEEKYDFLSELSLELPSGKSTPDISIYAQLNYDWLNDEIRVSTVPLGAIEIISPTQGLQELTEKAKKYFADGVKSYWIVVPPFQQIHVFSTANDFQTFTKKDILKDEPLKISLELATIFKTIRKKKTK